MVNDGDKDVAGEGRRELKRAIGLNIVVDALDLVAVGCIVSCLVRPCTGEC